MFPRHNVRKTESESDPARTITPMQSAGKTSSIESKVQITNTEILATPTVNPPAHLMEDARRVRDETELHDSRESTPQGKSIPGLSAGVLNKPLLSEPCWPVPLGPCWIKIYAQVPAMKDEGSVVKTYARSRVGSLFQRLPG